MEFLNTLLVFYSLFTIPLTLFSEWGDMVKIKTKPCPPGLYLQGRSHSHPECLLIYMLSQDHRWPKALLLLLLLLSLFSRVWLCATPQMAAHQGPLSLGFSRQEHWSLTFRSLIHFELIFGESKKKWYKWTYLQKRNRLTHFENEFMVSWGIG